ncbi:MAG TPA: hypothetical protein VNT23_08820 [Gaiellaceae bacterium]|nr:hypothetical protein [Gaiellaceae bacterium]
MQTAEAVIAPEPPPDLREAVEQALAEAGEAGSSDDAWGRAARHEATDREPRP